MADDGVCRFFLHVYLARQPGNGRLEGIQKPRSTARIPLGLYSQMNLVRSTCIYKCAPAYLATSCFSLLATGTRRQKENEHTTFKDDLNNIILQLNKNKKVILQFLLTRTQCPSLFPDEKEIKQS